MAHKGQLGASSTMHKSAARQKRDRKRRERENKAWAERSGEVKTYIDPSIMRKS
jgi:hypothetical protein